MCFAPCEAFWGPATVMDSQAVLCCQERVKCLQLPHAQVHIFMAGSKLSLLECKISVKRRWHYSLFWRLESIASVIV